VLGHGLRRGGIPSLEFWNLNDKLVYWVLFPALLFYKTSTISFSGGLVVPYATAIYGAFGCAVGFALLVGKLARFEGSLASSLVQGCARHNTFIALAVAERLYGAQGLAVAALTTALLIPVTNMTVVTLMVTLVRGRDGGGVLRAIAGDLVRNPLLIAVLLGIVVNLGGVGRIPVVHEMTQILGAAALPVVLMCVGANIRVRAMAASALPICASMLGKLVLFPAAVATLCVWLQLPPEMALVALVYGAVPTAPSGFTLARQMGGDAPVMAGMITLQTAIAFVTLPLTMLLAQRYFLGS
jgi:predicted permease